MKELATIQAVELAEITKQQQLTGGELRQLVGQFAQLLVALDGEIKELQKDLKGKVTVSSAEVRAMQEAVKARISGLCEAKSLEYTVYGKALREALWRELYAEFTIGNRYDLPSYKFRLAIDFIQSWNSLSLIRKLRDKYGGYT